MEREVGLHACSGSAAENAASASRIAEALSASTCAAASAAASLSNPILKSTMAKTSWWLRIAVASSWNDVGSGTASTNEPRPWNVSTNPSVRSLVTASRMTVRETENSSIRSASDGSFSPGPSEPSRIRDFSPATTAWASEVLTPQR